MYNKIVIGIDESYTRTGISIAADGVLLKVASLDFKGLKTKAQKRKHLRHVLSLAISKNIKKASSMVIICERIRTFSRGSGGGEASAPSSFLSIGYIKATGALIGSIVDVAEEYGLDVWSVDTRAWKSKVLGSSKGDKKNGNKDLACKFVERLGFNPPKYNKKGELIYDDDAADSACIALYGFIPDKLQTLKKEE